MNEHNKKSFQASSLPRRLSEITARDIAWIFAGMGLAYLLTVL